MHDEDRAIIKALVSAAWSDGTFAEREKEMIGAILEAYNASAEDTRQIFEYASTQRTLDDIDLSDLSAEDRRVVLEHAVVLSFVDGHQDPEELLFLQKMGAHLRIPASETTQILEHGAKRAARFISLL